MVKVEKYYVLGVFNKNTGQYKTALLIIKSGYPAKALPFARTVTTNNSTAEPLPLTNCSGLDYIGSPNINV